LPEATVLTIKLVFLFLLFFFLLLLLGEDLRDDSQWPHGPLQTFLLYLQELSKMAPN
jgi:hypothetical protein